MLGSYLLLIMVLHFLIIVSAFMQIFSFKAYLFYRPEIVWKAVWGSEKVLGTEACFDGGCDLVYFNGVLYVIGESDFSPYSIGVKSTGLLLAYSGNGSLLWYKVFRNNGSELVFYGVEVYGNKLYILSSKGILVVYFNGSINKFIAVDLKWSFWKKLFCRNNSLLYFWLSNGTLVEYNLVNDSIILKSSRGVFGEVCCFVVNGSRVYLVSLSSSEYYLNILENKNDYIECIKVLRLNLSSAEDIVVYGNKVFVIGEKVVGSKEFDSRRPIEGVLVIYDVCENSLREARLRIFDQTVFKRICVERNCVYVAGFVQGCKIGRRILLAKFSLSGDLKWYTVFLKGFGECFVQCVKVYGDRIYLGGFGFLSTTLEKEEWYNAVVFCIRDRDPSLIDLLNSLLVFTERYVKAIILIQVPETFIVFALYAALTYGKRERFSAIVFLFVVTMIASIMILYIFIDTLIIEFR